MLVRRLAILALSTAPIVVAGAQEARRSMRAVRRTMPLVIDGKLNDPAWSLAPISAGFLQSYPKPNAPATDPIDVRVLYDNDAIYVGIRLFDAHPDSIAAPLARRDPSGIYSDWVHVLIDSYHDRRSAFLFSVSPAGVKRDALESNDTNEDPNWDAVWSVATTIDSTGWTAEFRIPLSQLRFGAAPEGGERVWGFQVVRDVARRNERDAWSPWLPTDGALVSRFGDLTGIAGVTSSSHTELLPYVSSRLTHAPADPGNPFFRANAGRASAGADVKIGLPHGFTITGAINPDFGQVEVDPEVVNLTAFETFFPEKRPFFTEGSGIFGFGQTRTYNNYEFQQYFYSRRIGGAPTRSIDATFVDAPDATAIAAAAKLTGRAGPWTVGFMDAVTPRESARFQSTSNGPAQTATVEPLSNYVVGRLRRDFGGGTTVVGSMFTLTDRSLGDAALAPLLHQRAEFGGVDFEHGWKRGLWYLSGYAAGSTVGGAPSVIAATQESAVHGFQRPDASYLHFDSTRASLTGGIAELALQKTGTNVGSVSLKTVSPGFEMNDLGFQSRADYHALSTLIGRQSFTAGRWFQNYSALVYANQTWNYGGTLIYDALGWAAYGLFKNFWSLNVGGNFAASTLDDRLTRGGPLARSPGSTLFNATVGSDTRRPLSFTAGWSGIWDSFGGGQNLAPTVSMTARPRSNVLLSITPTFRRQRVSHQYVETEIDPSASTMFGRRYVFAALDQTTFSADTRINWTFTPALSLQLYAQPFVSAGRYSRFGELERPSTSRYAVYGETQGTVSATKDTVLIDPDGVGGAPSFTIGNPDFNIRSLRGNAVLRWEYRPGSALFVVWQQRRVGSASFGDFDFERDVSAIFRQPLTNVFLVKLTYWLGL